MRGAAGRAGGERGAAPSALLALSLCASLCAVGCASPRQAVGVGLIVVGTVAAAAGMATAGVFDETPDPSQPASARRCRDVCTRASDSPVDALLAAGGAAAVLAGEALANTPSTSAPASSTPTAPAAPAPPPLYAPAPAASSATQSPAPAPASVAPSATRCLGPLREPVPAGCAP